MPSASAPTPTGGARVFISYAHADADASTGTSLHTSMTRHLSALARSGLVSTWDDREILAGDAWEDVIDSRLEQADVILLFVTAAFIASDYCQGVELRRARERADDPQDRAIVVPIILESCDWESLGFAERQALPPGPRKGVSQWPSTADHHTAVVKALRRRLTRMVDADSPWTTRVGRRLRNPLWWQGPAGLGLVAALVLASVGGVQGWRWWQTETALVHQEVAIATMLLRTGRYALASQRLQAPCARRWVGREACEALDKMLAAAILDRPAALPGQIEALGERLQRLRAQHPDDPDLLYLGGALALRQPNPGAEDAQRTALADIRRALELTHGEYPEAAFFLAHLLLLDGRHGEAIRWLDLALKHNPNAPHYLNTRAYARSAAGDLGGAERDYRSSIEDSDLLASRIDLAALLWRRGQLGQALGQLNAAWQRLQPGAPALTGRDALPWNHELEIPGSGASDANGTHVVALVSDADKRCMAALMIAVTRHLQAPGPVAALTLPEDCGSDRARQAPLAVLKLLGQTGTRLPADRVADLSTALIDLASR